MFVQKLRRRLFGLKKADVYAFVAELDEKAEKKIQEKEKEISELKERVRELEANRDAVINALQLADQKAKEIVSAAEERADMLRRQTDEEIQHIKNNVNREIEIKRRAIKSYYVTENKKIDQIKNEVERMRRASLEAIQNFERQLHEVECMTQSSRSYVESAIGYAQEEAIPDLFGNVDREIPIRIVESISD